MNKFIISILSLVLLTSCNETNSNNSGSGSSESKSSNQCNNLLTQAVSSSIKNTTNLQIKWSDEEYRSCGVSFKIATIDFQVDLELNELGTANTMKTVGVMELSNAAMDFKTIGFYKDKEEITDLGDKAIYYNKMNNHEVYVLSGDNSFTVKTINWNTRGGDKDITVKVAKTIIETLAK